MDGVSKWWKAERGKFDVIWYSLPSWIAQKVTSIWWIWLIGLRIYISYWLHSPLQFYVICYVVSQLIWFFFHYCSLFYFLVSHYFSSIREGDRIPLRCHRTSILHSHSHTNWNNRKVDEILLFKIVWDDYVILDYMRSN